MIGKQFRLQASDVKKVLRSRKPFFCYAFVANILPNRLGHNRFAILLSGKNTRSSVCRNYFRRRYYDCVKHFLEKGSNDIVFVPKKGSIFNHRDTECIRRFGEDIVFVLKNNTPKSPPSLTNSTITPIVNITSTKSAIKDIVK
jgi:ribonuclease P protein component